MASPTRALHDYVVETVGARIVGGVTPPGSTLDLEALRRELEVSQSVLREALRVLAHKGLIGARTKVGTFVRQPEEWNLLDEDVLRWELGAAGHMGIFAQFGEMRLLIEPGAAGLAARRRTEQHLSALDEALHGMANSGERPEVIVEADVRFHRTIFAASGNSLVRRQGRLIEVGLLARDTFVHEHHVSIHLGLDRHTEVAEAIRREDPDGAAEAMRALIAAATVDAVEAANGGGVDDTTPAA